MPEKDKEEVKIEEGYVPPEPPEEPREQPPREEPKKKD